ncbi:MAG: PEP-CTERM sorting domain-containing protein [Chromatiales bacterium]|jgi:hypothetical protein
MMKNAPVLLLGLTTLIAAASVQALVMQPPPSTVDEPSILGLLAAGTLAGVLAWRARNKR